METIGAYCFGSLLLAIAVLCLLFPRRIQAIAVRNVRPQWHTPKWVADFVASPAYLLNVRLCGLIAFLMGSIVLWLLVSSGLNR
jgi:hypothetical protein